jgi:hypothetical protein
MEIETPNTGKKGFNEGYGGNGKVGIFALLNNDDEKDMLEMTDLLKKNLSLSKEFGGRFDCRTESDLKSAANLNNISGCSSIIVTGHSRHLDEKQEYKPIVENEGFNNKTHRALGGFNIIAVIPVLLKLINAGTTSIDFWCCESACFGGSHMLDGGANKTYEKDITLKDVIDYKNLFDSNNWRALSTLKYIALKMIEEEPKARFSLNGLNGVGSYEKGDKFIMTFNQHTMFAKQNEYDSLGKIINQGKKLNYLDQQKYDSLKIEISNHIKQRKCHYVKYTINPYNFKKY